MYHSFLIHSPADGHLGCFHVLAMINSAAMNIGVHVSLSDFGFLGVYAQEWDWQHPFSQGQLSDKRYNCKVSQPTLTATEQWVAVVIWVGPRNVGTNSTLPTPGYSSLHWSPPAHNSFTHTVRSSQGIEFGQFNVLINNFIYDNLSSQLYVLAF